MTRALSTPSHTNPLFHDDDAVTSTRERPGRGWEVTRIRAGGDVVS
ncbi:MAG: hypothetical protein M3254_07310 [Actinomycetota bacterium]|nr:hypothetical protein [Actinomycetota bacterium]